MTEKAVPKTDVDPKCTCNDEFYTTVCPIHSTIGLSDMDTLVEVTDGHLVSPGQVTIKGHLFECPHCQQATLLVNKNYIPKVCCECKKDVMIKSKVFSDFVREENSLGATEIAVGALL